jgi:hypothetical protein
MEPESENKRSKCLEIAASFSNWIQAKNSGFLIVLSLFFLLVMNPLSLRAQMTTISSGSFIIDMGIVPQTISNALKPYGMIYDLILNNKVPVKWVIAPGKVKDGVDFSYNGRDFKGGPFIILSEYRSSAVNARITYWQGQGVIGLTTTSPIDVPVAKTLVVSSIPRWTMDLQNGSLAVPYFVNAGIPALAYNLTKYPSQLGICDDIFVMPHADPQWSTHQNLLAWNLTYKGAIWLNCHAGSTLEDMFNPADKTIQTNFLSEKTGTATGSGPYCENALFLYSSHTNGTPPYSYAGNDNPFCQFMGTMDDATQNGSEQIYIPMAPGWRSSTNIAVWDPDHIKPVDAALNHRAAVVAYGRAFGDENRGYVMLEAAHSFSKATLPANIAAQRIFFNFSFMAGKNTTLTPNVSGVPSTVTSGTLTPISFVFPNGANPKDFRVSWVSACGGSFAANPAFPGDSTKWIFTPPSLTVTTPCPLTLSLRDNCGRVFNTAVPVTVSTDMQIVTTLTKACNGSANGAISMAITGAAGPFNYSWTRAGGGSGSGTGAPNPVTITGLAADTYAVTIVSGGGAGSTKIVTVVVGSNPAINALSITKTDVLCNSLATGSITIGNPSGGTPPFSFLWNSGATTQNRTGLVAGTYTVTATDAIGCTASNTTTIIQPNAISITPTKLDINCYGQASGSITNVISGGTPVFTYAWSDGATTQNRSGLVPGSYTLTVRDANNCTASSTAQVVSQPSAALNLSATVTNVSCNGGSTGAIDLTVTGGTTAYGFNWGSGVTTEDRTGLVAGDYSVTVTDSKGCTATLAKTITKDAAITVSTTVTKETCPAAHDGKIDLTATGGTGSYTYQIDGGSYGATHNWTGLAAGSHTVIAKDGNNCTASATVTIGTTNSNPVKPAGIN